MHERNLIVTEALCNDADNEGWVSPVAQRLGVKLGTDAPLVVRIACESHLLFEYTPQQTTMAADLWRHGGEWLRKFMGKTIVFTFGGPAVDTNRT